MRVEIILVDAAVLRGASVDSHARWLARRLSILGGEVARHSVVDEIVAAVAAEVRRGLMAGSNLIVVIGGRGTGSREVAVPGAARALGRDLILDEAARSQVIDSLLRIDKQSAGEGGADETHRSAGLARLPLGAESLPNPVGVAPGVWVEQGPTGVVCLPGQPGEMEAIFEASLLERIRDRLGCGPLFEASVPASGLALGELRAIAEAVMVEARGVYVREQVMRLPQGERLSLHISARGADATTSQRLVEAAVRVAKQKFQLRR